MIKHPNFSGIHRLVLAALFACLGSLAHADPETADKWGPAVGTTAPMLSALDQAGQLQELRSLSGAKGLLMVFNRSVDW
ncbi:MAG: hypothetical protein AAF918_14155 [Pseudomonadota bacterium]